MQQRCPASILVMGILNLLFGSGGIVYGLIRCVVYLPIFEQAVIGDSTIRILNEYLYGWAYIETGMALAVLLLSGYLCLAGVNLVRMNRFGVRQSNFYGWCTITLYSAYLIYEIGFVLRLIGQGVPKRAAVAAGIGIMAVGFLFIAYASVLLVVMSFHSVQTAFDDPQERQEHIEIEDDDEEVGFEGWRG